MRIISLAPSNTEILFAIGKGDSIIARTAYCDYPPSALKIPKIGDWVNPDIAEVLKLDPDLVLTSTVVQEKLAGRLMGEGLHVLHLSPKTLEDVFRSIYRIGEAAGALDGADALATRMMKELSEIEEKSFMIRRKPRIYIEEWHDPPFVSGNWVPKIAEMAGAEYGLVKEGELSARFDFEELRRLDPQIIVLSICGVKIGPESILRRVGWESLSAVKSGSVYPFDDSLLNRPGPRLVEGCRKLNELVTFFSGRTAG
jgi:iron complex transport system substrate-binding protein